MKSKEQAHIFTRGGQELKSSLIRNLSPRTSFNSNEVHPDLNQELLVRLK